MGKHKALVDKGKCLACGGCISVCPQDAIMMLFSKAVVSKENCIYCSICINSCPVGAIYNEVY